MKEYNFDNINEFFEDLMNKPNAKFNMLRVYGAYERECEENKRKQEIEEQYNWSSYYHIYNTVHIINDDIAIIEQRRHDEENGYYAHVNNKKSYYIWPTFEQALLCAVSIKLTGREDATEWMWKLVGGENNP